ncbi:MAG: YIP1 family protein [bacterium]
MAGVFIEPSESFRSLAAKPRWLVPLLVIIVAVFGQLLVTNEIRMDDLEKQVRSNPTYSSEEVQRRLGNIEAQRGPNWNWSGILNGLGFVSIAIIAQVLPTAFLLWLGLQFSPRRPRFLPLLAVVVMAFLVTIPEAVLTSALAFFKGTTEISLGPAVLLPSEWKHSPLYNLCFQLDIFNVWIGTLVILGLPLASGVSRRLAAVSVGYLWLVWLLLAMFVGRPIQIT